MTLPALGAQGGVAGQCRHVRARVGGRPPHSDRIRRVTQHPNVPQAQDSGGSSTD